MLWPLRLLYRFFMWLTRPREATMPDPKPIASHDAEIAAALAELRAARANFDHSPNSDNEYWITQAERRLNTLLDRRARQLVK